MPGVSGAHWVGTAQEGAPDETEGAVYQGNGGKITFSYPPHPPCLSVCLSPLALLLSMQQTCRCSKLPWVGGRGRKEEKTTHPAMRVGAREAASTRWV